MFYMQEFEIIKDDGLYIALPFDLPGGTQGDSLGNATKMAGEWLHDEMVHSLMSGTPLPQPTFGNAPLQGGRIVLVGMEATLSDVPSVSASEAASRLGVSRPRITKMLQTGQLEGWKDGRNTRVTIASIDARLAGRPNAGRPKKQCAIA